MKTLQLLPFLFLTLTLGAQLADQDFNFQFDSTVLSGVLNVPQETTPKGLILIVHGSGQTDAVAGNWYHDVREQFVRSGYAVFMWDKLGCGNSGGTFNYNQTVQSSAREVIAAMESLQERKVPGADAIGLWGISRAGWINPLVIERRNDVKFWISVSGVDAKENFRYLLRENLRINGRPRDTVELLVNEWQEGTEITHSGGSYQAYLAATQNLRANAFLRRFSPTKITEEAYYAYQKGFVRMTLDETSGLPVYVDNFPEVLKKVSCPVLALFGEKDRNVDWTQTKELYTRTLGQVTDLTVRSFPDCNHNMFRCVTGGFYEFADNELPWDRCDGFLATMVEWLAALEHKGN